MPSGLSVIVSPSTFGAGMPAGEKNNGTQPAAVASPLRRVATTGSTWSSSTKSTTSPDSARRVGTSAAPGSIEGGSAPAGSKSTADDSNAASVDLPGEMPSSSAADDSDAATIGFGGEVSVRSAADDSASAVRDCGGGGFSWVVRRQPANTPAHSSTKHQCFIAVPPVVRRNVQDLCPRSTSRLLPSCQEACKPAGPTNAGLGQALGVETTLQSVVDLKKPVQQPFSRRAAAEVSPKAPQSTSCSSSRSILPIRRTTPSA